MSNRYLILLDACAILWLVPLLESETAKMPDHPVLYNPFDVDTHPSPHPRDGAALIYPFDFPRGVDGF